MSDLDHSSPDEPSKVDKPTGPVDPSAPPGAACASHPEREAHFTCPRCGSYACVFCWHPSLQRCDACLRRDPAGAAPPIPWEQRGSSLLVRYLRTLAAAVSPARSAPSFARPSIGPAVAFMLATALPLSMLAGIVPHTRTLQFVGGLEVQVLRGVSTADIALDVCRAMLGQLCLDGLQLGAFLLPFMSLVRAYGGPDRVAFAVRGLLYRAWLPALSTLVLYLALSVGSLDGASVIAPVLMAVQVGAVVLFMMAMTYTARLACGIGMFWSIVIVTVCVVVSFCGFLLGSEALLALLPDIPPQFANGLSPADAPTP